MTGGLAWQFIFIEVGVMDSTAAEPIESGTVLMEVWSDFVCPFCYLWEPTLAGLEVEFPGVVEVRWRAFELRPDWTPT